MVVNTHNSWSDSLGTETDNFHCDCSIHYWSVLHIKLYYQHIDAHSINFVTYYVSNLKG